MRAPRGDGWVRGGSVNVARLARALGAATLDLSASVTLPKTPLTRCPSLAAIDTHGFSLAPEGKQPYQGMGGGMVKQGFDCVFRFLE